MLGRTRNSWSIATVASLSLLVGLVAAQPSAAAQDDPGTIAEQKASPLTPSLQQLAAGDEPRDLVQPEGPEAVQGEILTRPNGRLLVNVRLSDTSTKSLDRLRSTGARIRFVEASLQTVTVAIDPGDLENLAVLPVVESAREILEPMTNAACPSGPFVSEGVTQLKAALARSNYAVTGRDVTVGVLSDTYNVLGGAATDVGNGELPGTANPCGNTDPVGNLVEGPNSGIDEGRAMAQIIHDVAPGAKILFASAFNGDLAFAQSIRDLADQGADIIVDDITYLNEPVYQDGPIAKAVADVTEQGVTYFSSAANSNLTLGGKNVASYEAPSFRSATCPAAVNGQYSPTAVTCHDFDTGAGTDTTYDVTYSSLLRYTLNWSEPQFGVTDDFDLCLTNPAGTTVYGCADDNNLTSQYAYEFDSYTGAGPVAWVIVRYSGTGTPRLKLISHRSGLSAVTYNTSTGGDVVGPTIFGHNASRPGVTVAAVPYDNSAILESFSSFGPATYCWGPVVGTTPAGALNPCQNATVDLAATDGTQNSFFGGGSPNRFYGTSAAAPHGAAVAALMLEHKPCLTPDRVIVGLQASGRTVGTAPVDGAGAGLIDADAALAASKCETEPPVVDISLANGWFRTASVSAPVSARDPSKVTALTCTGADLTGVTGIGTTEAKGTVGFSGEGQRTITCQGTDGEDNTGAANGSKNTVTVGIDTSPPLATCRPLTLTAGQSGTVTADVSDSLSGPVAATVSQSVSATSPGTFSVSLTGTDIAGNTASAACAYTVNAVPSKAKITGAAKVKAGEQTLYKAKGFPKKAKVKWTVKRKGKTVVKETTRTNKSGVAKLKVKLNKKSQYVIRAASGKVSATKKVRVK